MKIWHDDIRRPPDETWEWARTNEEAEILLLAADIEEISLDHDLGLHNHDPDVPDADMQMGWDQENDGFDLVKWICENKLIPAKVTIHSWNPVGAEKMRAWLADHGCTAIVKPYIRSE